MHAYLFPFPVSQVHNATNYDYAISKCLCICLFCTNKLRLYSFQKLTALCLICVYCPVYRGFWSIFMLIGVAAVVLGGFFIICAAPFASHRLYKAGGGLFLASGETLK